MSSHVDFRTADRKGKLRVFINPGRNPPDFGTGKLPIDLRSTYSNLVSYFIKSSPHLFEEFFLSFFLDETAELDVYMGGRKIITISHNPAFLRSNGLDCSVILNRNDDNGLTTFMRRWKGDGLSHLSRQLGIGAKMLIRIFLEKKQPITFFVHGREIEHMVETSSRFNAVLKNIGYGGHLIQHCGPSSHNDYIDGTECVHNHYSYGKKNVFALTMASGNATLSSFQAPNSQPIIGTGRSTKSFTVEEMNTIERDMSVTGNQNIEIVWT